MRGDAGFTLLLCCGLSLCGGRPTATLNLSQYDNATTFTAQPSEGKPKAAPPFNLRMTSYNFNTTLYWDYPTTSTAPLFTVAVRFYKSGSTSVVKTCRNISGRFCDVSQTVKNPKDHYWGRVRAIVGDEESEYAESTIFSLPTHGKIGPPSLEVSLEGEEVNITVWHPVTPFMWKKKKTIKTVRHFYEDFTYTVFFGKAGLIKKEIKFDEDDCDTDACDMHIPSPEKDATYCITAKGISTFWGLLGELSEEKCVYVPNIEAKKGNRYRIAMFVCFPILAIGMTVLALVFVYKLLQKKNSKLPKSLASFAFGFGAHPNRQEATFDSAPSEPVSPVSVVDERAVLLNNHQKLQLNDEPQLQPATDIPQDCIENGSSPVSHETESSTNEYAFKSTPNGSSCSTEKDHYFHPESGSTELDSLSSHSGPPSSNLGMSTEAKPSCNVISQSFGYDKPHVPLSLSTQVGEGEAVIPYSEPINL